MKILIYGHEGWIGKQFLEIIKNREDIEICLGKIRCEKKNEILREILENLPTHIVSFIGRTHGKINDIEYPTIDYLENEGKLYENIRDNLFGPFVLASITEKLGIHYTYLGTGCIFESNQEKEIFGDDDEPNFFGSSYSIVKGFTDEMMHLFPHLLQLRIRMPIVDYHHPRNFITKIVNYEKICSIPNSMTVLPDLLPILLDMMEKKYVGTYNFTNPGVISHDEILTLYTAYVDHDFQWKNFTIEEQNKILKSKRSNNHLDTKKLEKLYNNIPDIRTSIENIFKHWYNN